MVRRAGRKSSEAQPQSKEQGGRCVKCAECLHSLLFRFDKNDPVLAECRARRVLAVRQDGKNLMKYPVEIASSAKSCNLYEEDKSEKIIETRIKNR